MVFRVNWGDDVVDLFWCHTKRSMRFTIVTLDPKYRGELREGWTYNVATAIALEYCPEAAAIVPPPLSKRVKHKKS